MCFKHETIRYYPLAIGMQLFITLVFNSRTTMNRTQNSRWIFFLTVVIKNKIERTSTQAPKLDRVLSMSIWLMFMLLEFVSCICESEKNILPYSSTFFPEYEKFGGTKRSTFSSFLFKLRCHTACRGPEWIWYDRESWHEIMSQNDQRQGKNDHTK